MHSGPFSFLSRREFRIVTAVLVLQAVCLYGISRQEITPVLPALAGVPNDLGGWHKVNEGVVEKEVRDVLRADDLLSRTYASPDSRTGMSLFVAYFRSQRTGKAPHSPKNCLPGAGWTPLVQDRIEIALPGGEPPITVNRYVVQQGDHRSVVLYWYQSLHRVVASEYAAKVYLVADSIRYNRSDTALVRVVAPVSADADQSTAKAVRFVQDSHAGLAPFLP